MASWVGGMPYEGWVLKRQQKMIIFNYLDSGDGVAETKSVKKINRFNSLCAFYTCSLLHVSHVSIKVPFQMLNCRTLNRNGLL